MDVVGLYLEPPERALALSVDGAASSASVAEPEAAIQDDHDDHSLDDHDLDNRNAGPKP